MHTKENASSSTITSSISSLIRKIPSKLKFLLLLIVIAITLTLLWNTASPISLYTASQCVFKSYYPVDNYHKSGMKFNTITDVIKHHGGGGFGSATLPTDKAADHEYNKVYDVVMPPYNNNKNNEKNNSSSSSGRRRSLFDHQQKMIELGVKKGGSMILFREFFDRDTMLVMGADIDPAISMFPRESGIKTMIFDSTNYEQVEHALGPAAPVVGHNLFSIVIDDGCHTLTCIMATFEIFWPRLDPRGVYIVEDFPEYYQKPNFVSYWSPHIMFSATRTAPISGQIERYDDGRRICIKKEEAAWSHGVEFVVVIYPKDSIAPLLPGCVDRMG